MTQYNLPVFTSPTPGRTLLKDNLEPWRDAVHSMHAGVTRPDYVVPQMMWIDTSATPWVLKVFQGSDDIVLGDLDPTTLQFSPSGSVDYNNLTNRPTLGILAAGDDASDVPASTANGLISTNAQGQIDELADDVVQLESRTGVLEATRPILFQSTDSTEIGAVRRFQATSTTFTVPPNGTWMVIWFSYASSGSVAYASTTITNPGIYPGGTILTVGTGLANAYIALCWRVS